MVDPTGYVAIVHLQLIGIIVQGDIGDGLGECRGQIGGANAQSMSRHLSALGPRCLQEDVEVVPQHVPVSARDIGLCSAEVMRCALCVIVTASFPIRV